MRIKILGDGINLYFGPNDGSSCIVNDNEIDISDDAEARLVKRGLLPAKSPFLEEACESCSAVVHASLIKAYY